MVLVSNQTILSLQSLSEAKRRIIELICDWAGEENHHQNSVNLHLLWLGLICSEPSGVRSLVMWTRSSYFNSADFTVFISVSDSQRICWFDSLRLRVQWGESWVFQQTQYKTAHLILFPFSIMGGGYQVTCEIITTKDSLRQNLKS